MARISQDVLLVGALGAGMALAGGYAVYQEANPYVTAHMALAARIEALADGTRYPGLAAATQQSYARECWDVARSFVVALLPDEQRQHLLAVCSDKIGQVLDGAPAFSYGWFVAAGLAEQQGDAGRFRDYLLASYETGPYENWIANQRFRLADTLYAQLDEPLREVYAQDVALIARIPEGTATLARRYVQEPKSHDRLTAIIEALDDASQRNFLRHVQAAMNEGVN